MKTFYNLVAVIPVGPGCLPEFIEDTINSIIHYTSSSYKIILVDDSQNDTGKRIKERIPAVEILCTPTSRGKLCGLYITLSHAFRHVISRYHFDALLRIDTDALIIGKAPEKEVIELFKTDSTIGMAGQYPFDYAGNPWDISWPKQQILKYTGSYKFFRNPLAHILLYKYHKQALSHGYKTGESVFGGACFFSESCLRKLEDAGLLPNTTFRNLNLEEDHLFSLLVKSVGLNFGDLSSGNLPFGCAWKGLPASPRELYASGKKIIHSTRYWAHMNEADIRLYFKIKRNQQVTPRSSLSTNV